MTEYRAIPNHAPHDILSDIREKSERINHLTWAARHIVPDRLSIDDTNEKLVLFLETVAILADDYTREITQMIDGVL
ncbi:MAG: hypothetical protein CMO30_17445 [Tistrella sp.]|nr:hypothetical protein [Tistrella sp.]